MLLHSSVSLCPTPLASHAVHTQRLCSSISFQRGLTGVGIRLALCTFSFRFHISAASSSTSLPRMPFAFPACAGEFRSTIHGAAAMSLSLCLPRCPALCLGLPRCGSWRTFLLQIELPDDKEEDPHGDLDVVDHCVVASSWTRWS